MKVSPIFFGNNIISFNPNFRDEKSTQKSAEAMPVDSFKKKNEMTLADYTEYVRNFMIQLNDESQRDNTNHRVVIDYKFSELLANDGLHQTISQALDNENEFQVQEFFESSKILVNELLKYDNDCQTYFTLAKIMENYGYDIESIESQARYTGAIDIDDLGKAINEGQNQAELNETLELIQDDIQGSLALREDLGDPIIGLRVLVNKDFNFEDCMIGARKALEMVQEAFNKFYPQNE